jgi:hypothetical protein
LWRRRSPRSTAFEVAGTRLSSKKVSAFSRLGERRFSGLRPKLFYRCTRRRSRASFASAVSVRHRRSNNR